MALASSCWDAQVMSWPDDTELAMDLPMTVCYRLVNHVTFMFWKSWAIEVSHGLVHRPI